MIIYGSRATELASQPIPDKCTNCGTTNSLRMNIFQKYAHVFWIPFFPIGKAAFTDCENCKQVVEKKQFSPGLHERYQNLSINARRPLWTFSGLAMLTAVVVWGVVGSQQTEARNAAIILTPQAGDIYEVKIDYRQYTLYKVDDILGDTVLLLISQYETNKSSGLRDIKKKGSEAYYEDPLPLHKQDLKTMFDEGHIIDIDR